MAPLSLDGETLGDKHRNYNKLLKDAVNKQNINLTNIDYKQNDLDNLLKIDLACQTRNVEYIINVLKCKDMLYVSRAIKQSAWLVTDPQYAHIINPLYLHEQLFPHMSTQAVNKLMLHIRLNLKDEKRVESFYSYLKDNADSYRWLEHCSEPFIVNVIQNERRIPLSMFKRLCKRSMSFAKYHKRVDHGYLNVFTQIMFLLKSNTEEFLQLLADAKYLNMPTFTSKTTSIIMKKCPKIILDNYKNYAYCVDASVVAKHMKKEEIKPFVLKHTQTKELKYYFNAYDNLKHYIKHMPKEEKFEFVKKLFIDKIKAEQSEVAQCSLAQQIGMGLADKCGFDSCSTNTYEWYKYAPFNVAFVELKKMVRTESSPAERVAILSILITCARKNPQNIKALLQFYYDKHMNEALKFKMQFINNFLNNVPTYNLDEETWHILNKLFYSMEVYTESDNSVQTCVKHIVLYNVLHNKAIPEIVEKKFAFETFKDIKDKLSDDGKNKLFNYLLNHFTAKVQKVIIDDVNQFNEAKGLLENVLQLLRDWKKPSVDQKFVFDKIKEFIELKKKRQWKSDLSSLYNLNKSWRKNMFNESLSLHPSEEVCLNALKHGPVLLTRHGEELATLRTNDSLRRLLTKLRIYWSESMAQQWTEMYLQNTVKSTGQKAVVNGLFTLLLQDPLIDIVRKYAPQDIKIQWNEMDPGLLSLQKNIAKCLHIARPTPSVDSVLLYAQGDYLQYTVPSLAAILHSLSKIESREFIPKLLDAPVSLQKYGLNQVFNKLNPQEQREVFTNAWNTTKNPSIRSLLFSHTYKLMCIAKDLDETRQMWQLLSIFIDNLNAEENKNIYQLLSKLPDKNDFDATIKGELFIKSFMFLTSLPAKANCEQFIRSLLDVAPRVMAMLNSDFVVNYLLKDINEEFSKRNCKIIGILSSYVLYGKTEEEQVLRYKTTLAPLMEYIFESWYQVCDDDYHVRLNFVTFIKEITWNFIKYVTLRKIVYPIQLFKSIQTQIERGLPIKQNYGLYTTWKLITDYVRIVAEHRSFIDNPSLTFYEKDFGDAYMSGDAEKMWMELHYQVSPEFGLVVAQYLKEDVKNYFHTIYSIFKVALTRFFEYMGVSYHDQAMQADTLRHVLLNSDQDFIPAYLLACSLTPRYCYAEEAKAKCVELIKMLASHPSDEVKMKVYKNFGDMTEIKELLQ